MPLLESILPMVTNLPTLSPFAPPIQHSPIVSRVLNFDEIEAVHDHQTSGYPRVKDTNSLDRRPNSDTAIEDVAEISSVTASNDPVNIELVL